MSLNFKGFLANEKKYLQNYRQAKEYAIMMNEQERFVYALGGFAFRQYQILFGSPESGTSEMYTWKEIAVACLGEEEVKKRLEAKK